MSNLVFAAAVRLKQLVAPAAPKAGENTLYFKSDDKLYSKNNAGTEVVIGPVGTGTVGTANIASHSVISDKMLLTGVDNLIYDPTFAAALGTSWEAPAYASIDATGSRRATPALKIALNATDQILYNLPQDVIRTESGWAYRLVLNYKADVAVPANGIQLNIRWRDAAGVATTIIGATSATALANTWTQVNQIIEMSQTAVVISIFLEFPTTFASGNVWIDAPNITTATDSSLLKDESVTASKIAVQTITRTHLAPGTLESGFGLTGQITIGQITEDPTSGIVVPQPGGQNVVLPADGSVAKINGDIVAQSLNVVNNLTVAGTGVIQGEIDMKSGVVPPQIAPTISSFYPLVSNPTGFSDAVSGDQGSPVGAVDISDHHSTSTLAVVVISTTADFSGASAALRAVNRGTWTTSSTGPLLLGVSVYGLARISTTYYAMVQEGESGNFYWYTFNSSFVRTGRTLFGTPSTFHSDPQIVTDGTNVGLIWIPLDGNLYLRWFNPATWNQVGSDITLLSGGSAPGSGVSVDAAVYSSADLGSVHLFVGLHSATKRFFYAWSGITTSAATRDSANDFNYAGAMFAAGGITYDATQGRFVSITGTPSVYTYSKLATATTAQAAYTWYDGDNSVYPAGTIINGVDKSGVASGTHETAISPVANVTIAKRSWLRYTMPQAPDVADVDATHVDKANRIGLYIAVNSGTKFQYSTAFLATGTNVADNVDVMPTTVTPVSNTFAGTAAVPGKIASVATRLDGTQKTYLDGAGVARVDGLIPPGSIEMYAGIVSTPPSGWLKCDGSLQTRTTFPDLFAAITLSFTATLNSTITVTGVATAITSQMWAGVAISGTGIPAGATVATVGSGTFTLSVAATASGAQTLCFAPYGVGNGTTTFNLPDMQGRFPMGANPAAATQLRFLGVGGNETGSGVTGDTAAGRDTRMAHSHDHGTGSLVNSSTDLNLATNTTTGGTASRIMQQNHTHNISGAVGSASALSNGPNIHAVLTLNFLIKT